MTSLLALIGMALITAAATLVALPLGLAVGGGFLLYTAWVNQPGGES